MRKSLSVLTILQTLASVPALFACGAPDEFTAEDRAAMGTKGEPKPASATEPLLGGTFTTARPEVVQISVPGYEGCTATFVTPTTFVTAAHCLEFNRVVTGGSIDILPDNPSCTPGAYCASPYQTVQVLGIWSLGNLIANFGDIAIGMTTPQSTLITAGAMMYHGLVQDSYSGLQTKMGFGCTDANGAGGGYKQYIEFSGPYVKANCPGDSGGPTFLGHLRDNGAITYVNSQRPLGGSSKFDTDFPVPTTIIEDFYRQWNGNAEPSLDRPGNDYWSGHVVGWWNCQTACANDVNCRAWSYQYSSQGCWFKGAASATTPNVDVISGINNQSLQRCTDIPGAAYATYTGVANSETCQAMCARDTFACFGYSFNSSTSTCQLKNSRYAFAQASCDYTSGWRSRPEMGYARPGTGSTNCGTHDDYFTPCYTATSYGECRDLCSKMQCNNYTFYSNTGVCSLSYILGTGAVGTPWLDSNAVSGMRHEIEFNTDRPGLDYRHFRTDSVDAWGVATCMATCAAESQCVAWSYVPPTAGGLENYNDDGVCWLKSGIPDKSYSDGLMSGLKGMDFF